MRSPTTPGHLPADLGSSRLAGLVASVFVCIGVIGFLRVLLLPDLTIAAAVASLACIVALLSIQLRWYAWDNDRLRTPLGYAVLGTQACLVYVPVLLFGRPWLGMPGFLAGSALLVLGPVLAWSVFCFVVASMGFLQWAFTGRPMAVLYMVIATVTTGLVVYGLSRLTALVAEVRSTRAQIARLAVLRERLRFARDLHDLLGYSLSAITLKIELTHRLMKEEPEEAADQLLEVLEISRRALSDARTVASGYREMSLEEECRSAVSMLSAADVAVRFRSDDTDLPVHANTVLATVLREGVTNLLRHSKAKHCDITVRQADDHASLEIANDAVAPDPESGEHSGGGLDNLSTRAKEIGGHVTVEHDDEVFRLRAEVPLRTARRSQPAGLPCDADGVDPVAGGQLADDCGEIVPDGAD